ncbi:MAG: hypothetical protein KAR17_13940, partial [Cyclobacteriaceae bacterium]|nr:hypothetical protein [Cyclobacteriaceae bacterium]MCK5277405.1 hypothetical protein [Cyclobacteriaceae bacterium]
KKLDGFAWRIDERPTKREILMNPSEVERIRKEVESMIKEEEEEKTKLEKLIEKNIDVEKIKDKLKKPTKNLQQQ